MEITNQTSVTILPKDIQNSLSINLQEAEKFEQKSNRNMNNLKKSSKKAEKSNEAKRSKRISKLKLKKKVVASLLCIAPLVILLALMVS